MATFEEQLKKSNRLNPKRLSKDLFKYIRSIDSVLIKMNQDQLKLRSKDIFNKPIGYYSFATELITNGRKAKGQPFNAFETGDFFAGFFVQEVNGVLRFGSTDPKTSLILGSDNWLSDDLFGLSDKDLKALIKIRLKPFYIKNLRDQLDI